MHVSIAFSIKNVKYRINTSAQDFPFKYRRSLNKLISYIVVFYSWLSNLGFVKCSSFFIPDITWMDLFYLPCLDQFFRTLFAVGKHIPIQFAKIGQKRLSIECLYAKLMQLQMVYRGIRKAKEF